MNVFGVAIVEPDHTYIPYDVYIAPGLVGMVLLFNGMQSSLSMVYDREMGLMRWLLTAPLPRPWILLSKLMATAVLSLLQAAAFVIVAASARHGPAGVGGLQTPHVLLAAAARGALMLGAVGLLLSVHIKQLDVWITLAPSPAYQARCCSGSASAQSPGGAKPLGPPGPQLKSMQKARIGPAAMSPRPLACNNRHAAQRLALPTKRRRRQLRCLATRCAGVSLTGLRLPRGRSGSADAEAWSRKRLMPAGSKNDPLRQAR